MSGGLFWLASSTLSSGFRSGIQGPITPVELELSMHMSSSNVSQPLDSILNLLKEFFAKVPEVKFAYLFGSVARGNAGPLSDLDIAVYFIESVDNFTCRTKMMESLACVLTTERFDLVVLNDAPITLKFAVVKDGKLLKDESAARIEFEIKTVREYLDTDYLRSVQKRTVRAQVAKGTYIG